MIKSYNQRDNSVEVVFESGSAKTVSREPIIDSRTRDEVKENGWCVHANCREKATWNLNTWCKEHWMAQGGKV